MLLSYFSDRDPCLSNPCPALSRCIASKTLNNTIVHSCTSTCKVDSNGRNYNGAQNMTVSGKYCLPWKLGNVTDIRWIRSYHGLHEDPELNYCRNFRGEAISNMPNGPWCITRNSSGNLIAEYCDVPYCADESE